MIDRKSFYDGIRPSFGGSLSQQQVSGMDAILDAWEDNGDDDLRKLSSILGQVKRETGGVMAPIHEDGGPTYFSKYGRQPLAAQLGNRNVADGILFHGRGPIMITGRRNYTVFAKLLGIDLVGKPDLALDPVNGAKIAVIGMMQGIFTGKKLGDYFTDGLADWINARRVVNGLDHADECAANAKAFYAVLSAA